MANLTNVAIIGTVYLHGWHGRLGYLQYTVDDYARIGQTGSGSQLTGRRSRKSQINAWLGAGTRVDAIGLADTLEGYKGSVLAVSDDMGRNFARVRVYEITATIRAGRGGTIPGGAQMLFRIDVDCVLEALP